MRSKGEKWRHYINDRGWKSSTAYFLEERRKEEGRGGRRGAVKAFRERSLSVTCWSIKDKKKGGAPKR